MAVERIGEMTLTELKQLIKHEVDERLEGLLKPKTTRSLQEILDSIDQHMWTPPPGTPSTGELLREDRDA